MKITSNDLLNNKEKQAKWRGAKIFIDGVERKFVTSIDTNKGEIIADYVDHLGNIQMDDALGERKKEKIKGKIRIEFADGDVIE